MSAQPAGELFAEIVEHCAVLQPIHSILRRATTPARRKVMIMNLHRGGIICDEDAELLIQAYQLETA